MIIKKVNNILIFFCILDNYKVILQIKLINLFCIWVQNIFLFLKSIKNLF